MKFCAVNLGRLSTRATTLSIQMILSISGDSVHRMNWRNDRIGSALLATAVERACRAADPEFRRINIDILGNTDAFVHAHVWPRYEWEPPELVRKPVWLYGPANWSDAGTTLGPQHDELRAGIERELAAIS